LHFAALARTSSSVPRNADIKLEKLRNDAPPKRFRNKIVTDDESSSSIKNMRVTLPFVALSLTFENIRYSVDLPKVKDISSSYHKRTTF